MEQNLKDRQEKAETTTKFLEAELKELDDRLALLGKKITKFKEAHEGTLPELQAHNLSQAERLENEIKQLENQIRASEDKKSYFEGQLATINPDLPIAGQERTLDPKTQLYTLQVQLAAMLAKNSENHPDVIQIKKTIARFRKNGERPGRPSFSAAAEDIPTAGGVGNQRRPTVCGPPGNQKTEK